VIHQELAGASQRKETLESAAAARAEEHAARQRQLSAAEEEIKASLGRIEASCLQQARAQAALNQAFGAATARCKAALKAGAWSVLHAWPFLVLGVGLTRGAWVGASRRKGWPLDHPHVGGGRWFRC
jgi:hypothetical protein